MRFTRAILADLWAKATTLPVIGSLARAVINETLEGSEGQYPDILGAIESIIEDLDDFKKAITWVATYRFSPCRAHEHENCPGLSDYALPDFPQFCTCPCHGDREEE